MIFEFGLFIIEIDHKRTLNDLQRMRARGVNHRVSVNMGTSSYDMMVMEKWRGTW